MVLPAPATALPEIPGRQRKIKGEDRERGGPRSCYQYKNWTWDAEGKRGAPVVVRGIRNETPDLINSAYWNPATCTQTVYALVWDLDADKADKKWLTKKGVLKWKKMRKLLAKEHPDIMRYVFAEQRSTSGKGISLALAISPLEIEPGTGRAQRAARALQEYIHKLLNQFGFGSDPSSLGLQRDFPNWKDKSRNAGEKGGRLWVLSALQSEHDRRPVVKELLNYVKTIPGLYEYEKKTGNGDRIYDHETVEIKLAEWLLEESRYIPATLTLTSTATAFAARTGISEPTARKILKNPPRWMSTDHIDKTSGWKITINATSELISLADACISGEISTHKPSGKRVGSLCPPEQVEDGQINEWIWKAAVLYKLTGREEDEALRALRRLVSRIPDREGSWSCKNVERLVRSIYKHRTGMFGKLTGVTLAEFLEVALMEKGTEELAKVLEFPRKPEPAKALPTNHSRESEKKLEKGLCPCGFGVCKTLKVSADRFFKFGQAFYSAPTSLVGQEVRVIHWGQRLRIYTRDGQRLLFSHELSARKGERVVLKGHRGTPGFQESGALTRLSAQVGFKMGQEESELFELNLGSASTLEIRSQVIRKVWVRLGEKRESVSPSVKDSQTYGSLPGQGELERAMVPEIHPAKETFHRPEPEVQMDSEGEDIGIYLQALEGQASAQEIALLRAGFEKSGGDARRNMAARIRKLAAAVVRKPQTRKAPARRKPDALGSILGRFGKSL